jgi:hypothetical protein
MAAAAGTCSISFPRSRTRGSGAAGRHSLAGLLAVGAAAVIAGSRSFAATGQWAADAGADVLAGPGADRGPAEESTFRRAFAIVSPDALHQILGAWPWTRAAQASGRLVTARFIPAVVSSTGQPIVEHGVAARRAVAHYASVRACAELAPQPS